MTADAVLFSAYLDFYREKAIEKLLTLSAEEQDTSRVPSVWTPLQLLHHLAYMEQRWFVWGFLAEQVEEPYGDEVDDVWGVPPDRGVDEVAAMMRATGERTRSVLSSYPLDSVASLGGRFSKDAPTLSWICLHVLQEYARHLGHLDVAVELAGGPTGE
jgi:uncharacterized damage-inducible protein DinB